MAVFNEPTQWTHTLGNNADVSTLPDDTSATSGEASLQKLFQLINQTPLEAGGVAPEREDINALYKILGDYIFFLQNGGVPAYNATYDYVIGRMVLYTDGNIYKCIQANGASSTVVAPDSTSPNPEGSDYWKRIDEPNAALIPNQVIISAVPLTDANLHLLDGALLSGSGAYADYVDLMQALYESDPTLECFTDEATWQASVTSYGVCGKFVWDSVNDTLRLPKITGFIEGTNTASELGELTEAGAPNITGSYYNFVRLATTASGALTINNDYTFNTNQPGLGAGNWGAGSLGLNASLSNAIYGNSNTIQPQSIKQYFYIVVGTVTKTQIQIDIDNYIADLALKADTDFSNAVPNQAFKNTSISWDRPDLTAGIDVTSQVGSGGYTCPSAGWIKASLNSPNGVSVNVNGVVINSTDVYQTCTLNCTFFLPVDKNDVVTLSYLTSVTSTFTFYPCKGAN